MTRVLLRPREAVGPLPTILYPEVPLDGATNIKKLKWSPSGRLILIEAVTASYDSSKPQDGLIVVLNPTDRTVVCRKPGMRHAFWGEEDSLWVWASNNWLVCSSPYTSCVTVNSGYGKASEFPFASQPWDFSTASNRLAVASHVDGTDDWQLRVFEEGNETVDLTLTPKNPNGGQRRPNLTFSPSGRRLAVVFSGWIGYEQPGPDEFWLVDVAKQSADHIHNGKCRWWQIFDCDTQSLDPSWFASEDAVAYGDGIFGIGELSIPTGHARTILGKHSDVYDILASPSGKWIAFERWPGEKGNADRYDRCMGVISRGGRQVRHLPVEFITWPYMYADWHPGKDALAVLRRNPGESTHDLLYWNLEEGASNKSVQATK
jgi:hypothetical protein